MANPLEVAAANTRGGRTVIKRSPGTAILDSFHEGTAERLPGGSRRIVRTVFVSGLVGPAHSKSIDAMDVVGMPRYGDFHPSPKAGDLPLSHIASRMIDGEPDKAVVTLTYEFPTATGGFILFENEPSETTAPQIEVTTTLNQLTTNLNAAGTLMTVEYKLPETPDRPISETVTQVGEASVMVPTTSVNYMRREPKNPLAKARLYVGKTNSIPVFGDAARNWLCTGLGGPSDDGGLSFNVTYSFQRGEPHEIAGREVAPGWDAVIVFIDPATGKPPADLVVGIGIKTEVMYKSINFWNLNLTAR